MASSAFHTPSRERGPRTAATMSGHARGHPDAVTGAGPAERFVGRADELGRVRDVARLVAVDGTARSVLVTGPPGIGKSAFVRQATDGLTGFTVLWAIGDSWESEVPYGVVSQLVAPTRPTHGSDHPVLFGHELPELVPHLVGDALVDLVGQLAERRPVAIVVDDLPFADPLSLRALAYALRRLRHTPVLLVAVARPGLPGADDGWRPMLPPEPAEVRLRELGPDDVAELARATGARWLPAGRLDRLYEHSGGHPLYVRHLLGDGDPALLAAGDADGSAPPRAVVAEVGRQTRALAADSARLLEALAVLGGRRPLAVVAELAGVARPDDALEQLVAANLVRSWPHQPQAPVGIRYPVQRDAVYETIAPNRRRSLHTAALGHSRGGAAWAHRVAASDHTDTRLAADLETAAGDVLAEGGPERAATFLLWSADLSADPADRERRVLHAAAHLLWNYRFAQADALHARVESAADSPLRSCILGRYGMLRGWLTAAEAAFERALADPAASEHVRALAATGLASLHCWLGRGAEAAASARRVISSPAAPPDLVVLARQCLATAALHESGPAAGLAEVETQLAAVDAAGRAPGAHARTLALRSLMRGLAGQAAGAVDDAEAALRLTRSTSVVEVDVSPQHCLAWAQYLTGQWEDAAAHAEHAVALAVAEGKSWANAQSQMVGALVAAGRGEWDAAEAAVAQTARWVRALGPPQHVVFSAMATAGLAAARGDHAAVLRALRPLTTLPDVAGWVLAYEPWWRAVAAEAMIATGDLAGAAAAVDRVGDLAASLPALGQVRTWLAAQLLAARGDEAGARRLLAAALDDDRDRGAVADELPLHRALLDETYGRLLLRDRNWRPGLRRLRAAQRAFTAIGAAPAAARCAAQLAASGLRADAVDDGPLSLLTERERAIAELVARGLTNHEVATRLFISAKTVSHHLGRIFTKLGVTSRRELRHLADGTDGAGATTADSAGTPMPPAAPRRPQPRQAVPPPEPRRAPRHGGSDRAGGGQAPPAAGPPRPRGPARGE